MRTKSRDNKKENFSMVSTQEIFQVYVFVHLNDLEMSNAKISIMWK